MLKNHLTGLSASSFNPKKQNKSTQRETEDKNDEHLRLGDHSWTPRRGTLN